MRAVVQRVSRARVMAHGNESGKIGEGLAVLLGIHTGDGKNEIEWMAKKIINLRIFDDGNGKMNLSLKDICADMLIVSQFTLYGDCRKGRRPGYSDAAPPAIAESIYHAFVEEIRSCGVTVATGIFQAEMQLELVNDGPVTLLLDTEKKF